VVVAVVVVRAGGPRNRIQRDQHALREATHPRAGGEHGTAVLWTAGPEIDRGLPDALKVVLDLRIGV
jgi:hypothetical protein